MVDLYPYQAEGRDFLAGRKAALLADDPGLGKTLQTIRAIDKLPFALRVLVICPASVTENWRREIAAFREADWLAAVYSFDASVEKYRGSILKNEFDAVVIDEAHFLKSFTAKRTRAIYGFNEAGQRDAAFSIVDRGQHTYLLTGTPMPNEPTELYPHLKALQPETITSERTGKLWTYHQFQQHYCLMRQNGFGFQVVGTKNEAKLNAKLNGFMLRRRKADVLKQLPPLRVAELYLEGDVADLDFEEADEVRRVLADEGVEGLRKLAFDGGVAKLRRLTGMAKAPAAAQWVNDWLDSTPEDRKIVVFAHHKDVIEALYDKLHTRAVRVGGHMHQSERQRAVDRLQNDPSIRCFIGQITAAGVGITLTAASDLLFVESSWVPAENLQARDRIHRIGQTEPCLVRYAMLSNSIDEDIQRACMRKMAGIAKVVDGEFN